MIINRSELWIANPLTPMFREKLIHAETGLSYGLTECGYDIRIAETIWLYPFKRFALGSSMEHFLMPMKLMGQVMNKSTWARQGLDASQTTNIEPGWRGHLTIELHYMGLKPLKILGGSPIAQVIFHEIAVPAAYKGRYQDQKAGAQPPIFHNPED